MCERNEKWSRIVDYLVVIFICFLVALLLHWPRPVLSASTSVTSLVFGQTSSAKTSTPNLQITVMTQKLRTDANGQPIQFFALQSGNTYNYYLTKTQSFTVTDAMIAVQIYAANAITLKVNSETAYKTIPSGETRTYSLK